MTIGDIVFIVGVFGIIYVCLQLARRAGKPGRKGKTSAEDK